MLGIAIINYNQYEKTIDCVNSVFETARGIDYKIYLLDNCSPNGSFDILRREYGENPIVDCFQSEKNLGYARGNNLCIEKALADGCDYILISNNDIVFEKGAINLLLRDIKSRDCLLIGPALKTPAGKYQISVKPFAPSFKEYVFSETYFSNFDRKKKYKSRFFPHEFSYVYWVSGAVFMADIKLFEKIGFFDPATFLYFEEYIISEKAKRAGLKLGFEPTASVIHYHGASTGGNANYFTRLENLKSELYFFKNYLGAPKSRLKTIRFIRCLEVLFTFTKERKVKDAFKFIKNSKKL